MRCSLALQACHLSFTQVRLRYAQIRTISHADSTVFCYAELASVAQQLTYQYFREATAVSFDTVVVTYDVHACPSTSLTRPGTARTHRWRAFKPEAFSTLQ